MRIYLAGSYTRKEELRNCRVTLERIGHEVTSSWLDESDSPNVQLAEVSDARKATIARRDWDDLIASETMFCFTEPAGSPNTRGGRHVELGLALAWNIPVYVIGPRETVFHWLGQIRQYDDFTSAFQAVASPRNPAAHQESPG